MNFWKLLSIVFIGGYLAFFIYDKKAEAAPHIANYYLGTLPTDQASLKILSKTDLLIISPDQFVVNQNAIAQLKKNKPSLILLAYVPSQSYNLIYWKDDLVFRNLTGIKDSWWLKDGSGRPVSSWPGLQDLNMDPEWSRHLVGFINQYISPLTNVDGIFFDIINDCVSHVNKGDVVLTGDGIRRPKEETDREWSSRVSYLLSYARDNIKSKYIVINGSSFEGFQKYVNGRMYETFPTPWEANGNWSEIMTRMQKNQKLNAQPKIYVFNSNSHNTGKKDDYKKVRFGVASSLMSDNVYFSYDHGDENHGQIWWYDEYDVYLGTPSGDPQSKSGSAPFGEDVWKREYINGLAVVNPTNVEQEIDLGGEYEKIIGTQDKEVNDGSIVDSVKLAPKDGILLYKTYRTINNVPYRNGTFLRFYNFDGSRARNGFFSFEEGMAGGAKIYSGDLDGDGLIEKIVISGPKIQIFNTYGQVWFESMPFGGNYKGELNISVANLLDKKEKTIVLSGSSVGEVKVYNYHGQILKEEVFPMGKKYRSGFGVALGSLNGKSDQIVLSTSNEILVYGKDLKKITKRFYPFGKNYRLGLNLALGDLNGDGKKEIIVSGLVNKKPLIRIFSEDGKKLKEITVKSLFFNNQKVEVAATDLNNEGRAELVVMTKN